MACSGVVQVTEVVLQARPKAIWRTYLQPDRCLRQSMQWYTQMGRRVWPYEIWNWFRDPLTRSGPTVSEFWGAPQDGEEKSMIVPSRTIENHVDKAA